MTRVSVPLVLAIAALQPSCDSPTGPPVDWSTVMPDITGFVTSELEGQLDGSGHFAVEWECPASFGEPRGSASAEELAATVARRILSVDTTFLPGEPLGPHLSEQHGHPIDWQAAAAGSRPTVCAESYLEPLPDTTDPVVVNHYGPSYLVPLYVGSDQVAFASVAAPSTVYLDDDGFHNQVGSELQYGAPPHGHPFGSPMSAEAAVRYLSTETGQRVARLPRLLKPGHEVVSLYAKWEIVLEGDARCSRVADGSPTEADTLYVGLYPSFTDFIMRSGMPVRVFVPDTLQPQEVEIRSIGSEGQPIRTSWPLRPGVPVDFWEVECSD